MWQLIEWCFVVFVAGSLFYYLLRVFPVTAAITMILVYVRAWQIFPAGMDTPYLTAGAWLYSLLVILCVLNDLKRIEVRFRTTNEEYRNFLRGALYMLSLRDRPAKKIS